MLKYSMLAIATIVMFSGCEDSTCCNGEQAEEKSVLGKVIEPSTGDPIVPTEPVLKKPTAVITPGECDDNARWFTCLNSKDNDSINPVPDIGIAETNIVKCEWTINVFGFDETPNLVTEYSSYSIFYEDGTLDPSSTSEIPRWIGHDMGYKIIELKVIDDDGQESDLVIKKFDYSIGECGDLVDP